MGDKFQPLSLRAFDWRCLRLAFRGKRAIAEGISGTLTLLSIPFGFWLGDAWGPELTWFPFLIFITVFIGTVAVGLWVAPYQVYLDEARKAASTAIELAALKDAGVVFSFEDRDPFRIPILNAKDQGRSRVYRFLVKNESRSTLTSCKAQLVSAVDSNGVEMVLIPFTLQSASGAGHFSLRRGESELINLFVVAEEVTRPSHNVMRVAAEGEPWPESDGPFTGLPRMDMNIVVQVVSDGAPAMMTLRLSEQNQRWTLHRVS